MAGYDIIYGLATATDTLSSQVSTKHNYVAIVTSCLLTVCDARLMEQETTGELASFYSEAF